MLQVLFNTAERDLHGPPPVLHSCQVGFSSILRTRFLHIFPEFISLEDRGNEMQMDCPVAVRPL
jgi:hypothetical protein